MAIAEIRPDWTIGTLNLTSGSTAFTTTGSMLQTAAIQAGDTIMVKGFVLVIATITGQNAGTLMEPCPAGAAGSGQSLRIRFQPDGSRYNGATAELVQMLSGGNTYALAGVTGANNTMPYFTGAGTMGRTDLTAWARTLLAAANGGAAYGALGVVPDSSLPSRIQGAPTAINNLDIISENGLYWTSGGATGNPASGNYYVLHQQNMDGSFATQQAVIMGGSSNIAYSRKKRSGVWEPWEITGLPILGTVSQSSGVPTGAIIQRGSNANGEFVRYADGTQICTMRVEFPEVTTVSGSVYRSGVIATTYPAVFSNLPVYVAGFSSGSAGWAGASSASTGSANLQIFSGSSLPAVREGFYMAIGRWF